MMARFAKYRLRRVAAQWRPWCALALWVVAGSGCANCQLPRIDPTGEHIFARPGAPVLAQGPVVAAPGPIVAEPLTPLDPGPRPRLGAAPMAIVVTPSRVIAPVGTEVVLIAGVGTGSYVKTSQEVQWTISGDSVGEFLSPGIRRPFELGELVRGLPRKVNGRYAVNATLFSPMTLDRGTPTPTDDITVVAGQSWVSVYSPTEGTSNVTAYAPTVVPWDRRQQTAMIYWVDAQWRFPSPANTDLGGRNTLSTVVTRQSTSGPLMGWMVRYEIVGGPEAGFAPDGATAVEVPTNEAGEARVEIFQKQEAPGANQVTIQVIRPAGAAGQTEPLTVGTGATTQSWGNGIGMAAGVAPGGLIGGPPSLAAETPTLANPRQSPATSTAPSSTPSTANSGAVLDVAITGPGTTTVGSQVQFEVSVTNRGTARATRLLVTDRFDAGLQHAASASPIERDLVDLEPGGSLRLTVSFQAIEAGDHCQDVEVTGDGGLRGTARACLSVADRAIEPPADSRPSQDRASEAPTAPSETVSSGDVTLNVRSTTPERRRVGEIAHITIEISNRGSTALTGLTLVNKFPALFEPQQATEGNEWLPGNVLGWKLASLAAGHTIRREIEFKCVRESPRACVTVTLSGGGIGTLSEETCIEIVGDTPQAPAESTAPGTINVEVADTVDPVKVNGETTYHISVENKGSASQFNVVVSVSLGDELKLEGISGPVQGSVLPGTIRFAPIKELRAGEPPLTYELRMRAVKAGTAQLRVEVSSQGQSRPATAEQTTQVIP
jgi:uncharacterized repeat protein (TIGR01451 family)